MHVHIHLAKIDDILPLRHDILRAGLPRDTALFPGDELPSTLHLAARDETGTIVGCLTLHLNTFNNAPAYQLRGMAIAAPFQRHGIGRQLLHTAEAFVRQSPVRTLWCNARTPAIPFYTALGWQTVSDIFDIPTAGPHVKMLRTL
jgi:predicted GNAT family N-acyltransferase